MNVGSQSEGQHVEKPKIIVMGDRTQDSDIKAIDV
jgi:hypothetical protein